MWPSASSPIVITSAIDSRHGSSLEWCSYGPMNTTGRAAAGMCSARPNFASRSAGSRRLRMSISLLIAPVAPEPQKITTSSGPPPTAALMIARASSRKRVVCRPVPEVSVWVFA